MSPLLLAAVVLAPIAAVAALSRQDSAPSAFDVLSLFGAAGPDGPEAIGRAEVLVAEVLDPLAALNGGVFDARVDPSGMWATVAAADPAALGAALVELAPAVSVANITADLDAGVLLIFLSEDPAAPPGILEAVVMQDGEAAPLPSLDQILSPLRQVAALQEVAELANLQDGQDDETAVDLDAMVQELTNAAGGDA